MAFQPGSAAVPSTLVEISISARNLKDRDAFSKSDPLCVVFSKDLKSNSYYELGRTEMIKDTLNPEFVKTFQVHYYFEESQKFKFELYDVDSAQSRLEAHDFLGRIETTLGEIVGAASGKMTKPLQGQGSTKVTGDITVRAEEVGTCKEVATLHFSARKLDKKDFLGKSDPFLIIYRANQDNSYTAIHKTEVIKNTLDPTWRPFTIPVQKLCNGDYNRSLKIECFDWDSDGSHDLIGEFRTTLKELSEGVKTGKTYEVINPKKKAKKKGYKNSGMVNLQSCKIDVQPSFLDFLKGGTQLNFTVAIDFTASNGNPSQSTSLHYFSPYQPNQYSSAIHAVGEIIQDYDSDKMFPVLGFGARLPDGTVSHEFSVNFNPSNPYVQGVEQINQVYYTALQRVQLYGPTNFSPIINHVSRFASESRDGSNYFVLLILTDGVISDLPATIESIVRASQLPMSVIIVGVGNADFDAMDVLDADNNRLSSNGRYAVRDIVQFVPFRNFIGGRHGNNSQLSQAALSKEVLAEIPTQVLEYMKANGIKPKPPKDGVTLPGSAPPQGYAPPPGTGAPQGVPPGQPPQRPPPPSQGSAPYPQGGQPNTAPYNPQSGASAPYPQGGMAPPYPQAGAPSQGGTAPPYPQGGAPPPRQQGSSAPPYPQGGAAAPYQQGGSAPPYPQGGAQPSHQQGGSAPPYPQGGAAAPYQQGGSAPSYPQGGSAPPYPQGGYQQQRQ